MKRRTRIVVMVFAALLLVVGVVVVWWRVRAARHMPMYQGKTARYWLTQVFVPTNQQEAFTAFRQMGSNVSPMLIDALGRRDTAWDRFYAKLYPRIPGWVQQRLAVPVPARQGWLAAELVIQNHMTSSNMLPALLPLLADRNNPARDCVMQCVLSYATPADTNCIPVFVQCLADTNLDVRYGAATGLPKFGSAAKAAVPALTVLMNDRSMKKNWPGHGMDAALMTRMQAARAVWQISFDSGAAEKVIREGLTAPDIRIRDFAIDYLIQMKGPDMSLLPVIIDNLANGKSGSQMSAIANLGAYGPRAKEAVPTLRNIISNTTNPNERDFALRALKQIDPEAAADYEKR